MPFDLSFPKTLDPNLRTRPVAIWLFVLCAMILVMVTLGGATRLTGSGLSIMEWAPIMGSLPPVSETEWQRLFGLYQRTSQYALINSGFGLGGFKQIFWLEWTHRLWGRLMGLAFALPLLWFVVKRQMPAGLWKRLVCLLVLGGAQGAIGWFMVASGFEGDRTAVSPYRLVMHLALALILYASLLWTALGVWRPTQATTSGARLTRMSQALIAAVALTILAGGFVAGLKAGLTYNSFPLMDGQLIPAGYGALHPFFLNLTENVAAVQFDHRLLATLTAVLALATVVIGITSRPTAQIRRALLGVGAALICQYALGVATLLYVVPIGLATLHQATAVLLLTAAIVLRHTLIHTRTRQVSP